MHTCLSLLHSDEVAGTCQRQNAARVADANLYKVCHARTNQLPTKIYASYADTSAAQYVMKLVSSLGGLVMNTVHDTSAVHSI